VRPFPQGMPGMAPHMMRSMPNNYNMGGMDMNNMQPMDMMMQQNMMQGQMMNPMMQQNMGQMNMQQNMMGMQGQMDGMQPELNDPTAKRDYFGEKLYTKISTNQQYTHVSDHFSKIVGIFLDLDEPVIERLINDDTYFDLQVRETMRLLAERGSA
jgi:hypothetical protein